MSLNQRVYDPEQRDSNVDGSPETFESKAFAEDIQQPFPIDRLPPSAREMAKAICETERVPESLAGCCVLAVL